MTTTPTDPARAGKDHGFTLVELLIVIVILGILATVTVFAVRGITDKGTKSACDADKKTIETAVEAYFAQYGGSSIAHSGTANVTTVTGGPVVMTPAVADPIGAAQASPAWTRGVTPDDTLVAAKLLRSKSAKWVTSPNGQTLYATTAGACT